MTLSEKTKKKMSLAHVGKKMSEAAKKKISKALRGRKRSEETKTKLSQIAVAANWAERLPSRKGKPVSEETRKKISEAKKGKHLSKEIKKKISLSKTGKPKSPETRKKMRDAMRKNGRTHSTLTYIANDGYVQITGTRKHLHRVIAERVLGRPLKSNEVVHHINGDRADNRNTNLVICERPLHRLIHKRLGAFGNPGTNKLS